MSVSLSPGSAVEEKRRLLARLLEERAARPQSFPLSFTQQRLWFLDQLDPGSPAYQLSTALRLRGLLSPAAFEASLREIVRRHKVLRTRFTTEEGEPVQIVDRHIELTLPAVDLSGLPDGLRQGELRRLVQGNLRTLFDLRHGHLFRATLIRLEEREHAVLLAMHHIVSDGWSNGVIVRELVALYPAFCAGRPSPLPRLPLQYGEYAAWQRRWLTGDVLEAQLGYWRERLSGTAPLELSIDHPRPAVQTFRGAAVPFSCPSEVRDALAALGRRQGATLFMALLAVFQTLLGRFSGQEDVSAGSPIANRGRRELEPLVGFFANTLVLRADLSGDPPFRELLEQVREVALGAFAHQDMPLEKLVQEVQPERDLARAPLFQVLFALQTVTVPVLELPGLALEPIEAESVTAKSELTLDLGESPQGLGGSLEYNTDLFDRTTALRLVGGFLRLLRAAVAAPEARIGELPVLSPAEQAALLFEWNDTAREPRRAPRVHELVAAQAERTPEAAASSFEGESLSYREIAERSAALAGQIQTVLASPLDRPIALLADPDPQVLIGMVGILRAGGGFVPLDPRHPEERLAWTLADSACEVLVTQRRHVDRAEGLGVRHILCLEDALPGAAEPARKEIPGGSLAYVVYTSGSTGRPKGVQISHENLAPMLLWGCAYFGLGEHTRVLQSLSFCFDFGIFEHLTTLLAGGTLIFPGEAAGDPRAFAQEIGRQGINTLHATPAFARELAAAGVSLSGLDILHLGGEALSRDTVARLHEAAPRATVYNGYGPTEATVNSSIFRIGGSQDLAWPVVPIGRRSADNALYVLDGAGRLVPFVVRGELHVGGIGVARGYLNRPDLTAERFVPDPFAASPGGRLYRTGDLVRYLPGGDVEFLGRLDHQVKIRGFRIELGEVEAALASVAGVREAAVVAREGRLVAYVVGDVAAESLRRSLRERLPDSMVPSACVTLPALPLTSNGKVDRKALPALEGPSSGERYVAPRTPAEEVLAGIWAELLGLERVGSADDFFALGGHSLLAMRVMSRLRSAFGVEMPLHDLFEAPRLGDLAVRIEAARRAGAGLGAPPLVPVPREGSLPLSFAQQRLWFIDQLEPGSPLYNIPAALRIEGPLDIRALRLTLGEIVRRHEALRTVFAAREGLPVQRIRPAAPFTLPAVDLSGLPERAREATALRLAGEEAGRPFDLTRGPLLRGALLWLAEGDHAALLTMHHIVGDGWSVGILVQEVMALYTAFAEGRPSPLPELPVQYADFAVWQNSWLHGEILENEIAFWRRQLEGLPPRLELPTDRPRPRVQSFRGASEPLQLPAELTRQMQNLGRREGATLFMVLLAAFQAALARYSGQDDLAVGTPVAGRNRTEIEGLIGFFVNTLVLRGDLTGVPSFRAFLGRTRETALAAHTHQDVPFEKVVEELAPERSLAHTPLFQVMFALQNAPAESLEIRDLRLRPFSGAGTMAKFDLTLSLVEAEGGLLGAIDYATDLFDAPTIKRLLLHWERLLASALADPQQHLADLGIFSPAERAQFLVEWNDTAQGETALPVHRLFALQAQRTPAAVAVRTEEGSLTYGELAARVRAWASHLSALGAGPEQVVAVCLERSADLLAALLAVLASGAAYLPLEPRDPEERRVRILEDARPLLLLTRRAWAAGQAVRTVCVEDLLATVDTAVPEGPPGSLAYVLYTSGSTGRPKGVAVDHASLSAYLAWIAGVLEGAGVRWLPFLTSVTFDPSLKQLFVPLLQGEAVRVVSEDALLRPARLLEILDEAPGAGCNTVPALWDSLLGAVERGEAAAPAALCAVFLGGERLSEELVARTRRLLPGVAIHNLYGPTEATANAAWARLGGTRGVVLGRPVGNARIVLTDGNLRPVPLGAVGEICIGGSGVARGYLGRPEPTAERFVPDPFGRAPGARLYRTGDLARQGPDGTLRFVGRTDDQVKVRGVRIELAEIEEALAGHPAVREAAVVFLEGAARLVACVVPFAETPLEDEALRAFLRQRLPEVMVPAAFLSLGELPRTGTNKLDRRRLAGLAVEAKAAAWAAPRTPVEEVLAGVWAELLGLERVGVDDHFFAVGGHSLLATRVLSRLRSVFGVELPLRDLFEAPVLADLAARVEAARRSGEVAPAPPLVPVPRQGALPLSFAQQRLWFIDQLEPGSPLYNLPVALRVEGPLDAGVLALCLGEIVRRHEALRTVFAAPEGSPVQRIQPAAPFALPVIDLSGLPEAAALRLAGEEAGRPFDLTSGPLLRGALLRLAQGDHVVLLTMHHIVSDGWSVGILVREVTALYAALAEGRPSPLPELPVQYADFAVWQASWLHGEILENEIAFWRRQLAGLPPRLELPTDRPRPAVQSFRGALEPVRLPAELTRQIEALGRREGATLFMVLLAAFQALLARYSGQDDLAVGSPVAGRNRTEIEGLIGFFVNTVVLRGGLTGAPSFRELLGRTREAALAAHAHQDVPFEKLVEELSPERSLAYTPLFQVMLALQNAPAGELRVSGLTFSPVDAPGTTAKFDLTLSLGETPEGLAGALEYATDLFDRATVGRLLGHLANLLASAVADPGLPWAELRLMGAAEEEQLRSGLNRTERTWAAPVAVHDLFLGQAERTPDKTAAGELTYRDLVERSAALAGRIHAVLPNALDRPIALLADPDPQVLIGMIGILEAGGGFVPLDPRHPEERLAWTLEDAACEVLVTQRRHREQAEKLGVRHILCLEDALPSATEPTRKEIPGGSLAYVVYTSGSTGRPKGVQISHENLAPMLLWGCEYFGLGGHTRVLQSLSFCFDFGIFEHLTTLLSGGTLVFPGEAAGDPRAFAREIVRHGINTLHTTPAFARELAAAGVSLSGLDILHLGGEALSWDTVARLREAAPRAAVYNGYGPTEATVNSSIFRIGGADDPGSSGVPIGRRSADNALYVLDDSGCLVPFGVRGELHVGGIGVARGYLNRPDLTAERFVPDPFGLSPGGRLYRTGDLVRYLPQGDIEFLGRLDHQVKIRGFRIELGEVEAALVSVAGVREAVVVAREDRPGDRRLVAYVVGDIAAEALRRSLRDRLPDSMVPAAFVTLAALPLTSNGKVDRKALPAPDRESAGEIYVAPRTPVEEILAGIWAELLGPERVGSADDFFALGGHSLLATRVVSRLRDALGIEIPLREIFEAPRLGDLAARIEAARRGGAGLAAPPLARVPRAGDPPLSFSQERLWFLDQLEPGNPTYNIPGTLELTGPLDVAALAAAWSGLAGRHEVLRTVFRLADGEPRQHILPALDIRLPVLDLAGLPPVLRLAEAERLAAEHARKRFDLARGPLLDTALLRLEAERHHLLVVLHHVICDGWSISLLVRELGALYATFAADRPFLLPELPVQYADFAVWQREVVAGARQAELAWWMDRLGGEIARLDLPADRPRPAVQTYRGGRSACVLPPGLAARLTAFGRTQDATLFMILLAAIQALLHRHSGQDDILVGAPVAGRRAVEVEGLIGCFLNTLVLRTDLGGQPGFRELVARVREVTLGAYSHQDVPFEAILTSLPQLRDLSRTPLFQVMVNLLNLPSAEMHLPGLTVAAAPAPDPHSKFDMTFYLSEGVDGVHIDLVYNADLFDAGRMAEILLQLEAFLDQALERPDEPVGALSLVTAAARAVLPDPAAELSAAWEGAVHEVFARHAERAPHSLAVSDPAESWTYAELQERAGRLAACLRAGGVGPGGVVAFWAHRSAPLVWGVLGALQAGAAFLLLDPRHPAPRQAQMVSMARPAAWLRVGAAGPVPAEIEGALDATGCTLRLALPAKTEAPAFLGSFPDPLPAVAVGPDDLAYVAFTSGSTGVPKGVLGRHGSLSHFIPWLCRRFGLSCADRYSLLSGLAHDPLHRDLFTPLQTGAAVMIPDPETMDEPGRLAAWMCREGVTVAHLTPALGQLLTTEAADGLRSQVPTLRYAFLVGDILTRRDVARLRDLAPAVTCVNYYGSTETQRAVGYHVAKEDEPREVLPLGRGIPDVQLLVRNPAGHLAGIGELGEVSVRSPHIALGYLGDPQLTGERFGADLYRTGDLGRYLPNGEVELVGRADAQVKIRGFRIEPGEIESWLGRFPGVRDAVVIARQEEGGERYLAAYVVPEPGAELDARELRTHLRGQLPDAMVPAAFVFLDQMPLTPNRKVDRKALPAPERRSTEESLQAPRTPVEEILAGIWAELLGLEQVGAGDDFFALGGHSLLAVRLMARIESAFEVKLPISTLFEAPTVERLAAVLSRGGILRSRVVRLHRGGAGRPLFLLHPIGGDVFAYVELARRLGTDRPVYGLQAVLATGENGLTMEELAAQYLATLRQVQPEGPWLLAGWSFGAVVAYEMAQQIEGSGETVSVLAMIDPPPPPSGQSAGIDDTWLLAGFASRGSLSERQKTSIREAFEGLDVDAGLDHLIELGRAQGWLPPDVDRPQLRERFDLYSRNVKALHGYVPRPYPGRVTLFRASGSLAPGTQDLTSGWGALVDGKIHLLEADHESLLRSPVLDRLVEDFRSDLREAGNPSDGKGRDSMANVAAIIGFAGRFPAGTSIEELWRGLEAGAVPAAEGSPGPWISRVRLLLDAAAEAAGAARLEGGGTGLFVSGDEGDSLAAEAAGELELRGPVETVPGPPLGAVGRACKSLGSGECGLALAGGVPIRGEGVWVVALARLPQALAAGDRVLAVVRGSVLAPLPALVPQAGGDPAVRERPVLATAYTPPGNPLEAAIASVWQEQLGVDRVGIDDNFFELGGTSIAGVKIVALLKEWLHQDIPTVSLYEGPTVRALARVLLHTGEPRGYDAVRERGERRRRKLQRLG